MLPAGNLKEGVLNIIGHAFVVTEFMFIRVELLHYPVNSFTARAQPNHSQSFAVSGLGVYGESTNYTIEKRILFIHDFRF